ncbi:hypothetical protein GCM10012280_20710 [Wenjunlia tyrosinilytica]|uniref:Uncharacterized protein n=1 Tax=Wenjunlia tyrosinilytica TaxID=1544741 RepID=A0A918DWL0_9ACTN|nr:hypothetical protein GCM10012280_20710 [Wenjunlia tyrosinilytica]
MEESAKKSGLVWVRVPDGSQRALWHVWHDGAVHVVGDGDEQPLYGLQDGAETAVTVRSKDKGGRLVSWPARVVEPSPGSEGWKAAVEELKGKRLNAPDTDTLLERWASQSRVLRLEPTGPLAEGPQSMPSSAHAAPPVASAATTRRPAPAALPRLLTRRGRKP